MKWIALGVLVAVTSAAQAASFSDKVVLGTGLHGSPWDGIAEPQIACGGGTCLAVWQDSRTGVPEIWGTRISTAGTVVDAAGVALTSTGARAPAVAYDGSQFVVVFESGANVAATTVSTAGVPSGTTTTLVVAASSPTIAFRDAALGLVSFTRTGATVDAFAQLVVNGVASGTDIALESYGAHATDDAESTDQTIWNGEQFATLWQQGVNGYVSLLDPDGTIAHEISDTGGHMRTVCGHDGATFLVGTVGAQQVMVVYEDSTGAFTGGLIPADFGTDIACATDGSQYLIVGQDSHLLASADATTSSGLADNDHRFDAVQAVWTGSVYATVSTLAVDERNDGWLHSFAADATSVTGDDLTTPVAGQDLPALASIGDLLFAHWSEVFTGGTDVGGSFVSVTGGTFGTPRNDRFLHAKPGTRVDTASNGSNIVMAAWVSSDTGLATVNYARSNGAHANPSAASVSSGLAHDVAIAWDGVGWVVTWADASHAIYARRVTVSGNAIVLGGERQVADEMVDDDATDIACITDTHQCLIVWQTSDGDIRGAGVRDGGLEGFATYAFASTAATESAPHVATDGDVFVLAYAIGTQGRVKRVTTSYVAEAATENTVARLDDLAYDGRHFEGVSASGLYVRVFEIVASPLQVLSTSTLAHALPVSHAAVAATATPSQCVIAYAMYQGAPYYDRQIVARYVTLNTPPVAFPQTVGTTEDHAVAITLTASDDEDDDTLQFSIVTPPVHGTLAGTAPDLTYTPDHDFAGFDAFTFAVTDGQYTATATVMIGVSAVNDVPVATGQSVTLAEDTTAAITLAGVDVESDALTFAVATPPAHGTFAGGVYAPAANYHGSDSFTFTASDGVATSAPATVAITVTPVNDAPSALVVSVTTAEDTPVTIAFAGADIDGDALTYAIVTPPAHGTISNGRYTPVADYAGADAFTYAASDGTATSTPAVVTITVTPVNDPPALAGRTTTTDEDTAVVIHLAGTDADGDALTYAIAVGPAHGTATLAGADIMYTPAANYHGADLLTATVADGTSVSPAAAFNLTVVSVNDPPIATAQTLVVTQGVPAPITLAATDVDGDALTFAIASSPDAGALTGTAPDLTFTPPATFQGDTSFTFTATDGAASSTATVTLRVGNGAPVVTVAADHLLPVEGTAVAFTAPAADPGGDPLTFAWTFGDGASSTEQSPTHTYADDGAFTAEVSVTDGLETATASVVITVQNAAPSVVPSTDTVTADETAPVTFTASATDPGADMVSLSWNFGDGTLAQTGGTVTHAFADDGVYTVTVTASDGDGGIVMGTRTATIHDVPPSPMPVDPISAAANEPLTVALTATDPAGARDPLTWSLLEGEGTVSPSGTFSWTPPADIDGTVMVRAQVSDGDGGTAELVFSITVIGGGDGGDTMQDGGGCSSTSTTTSTSTLLIVLLLAIRRRGR